MDNNHKYRYTYASYFATQLVLAASFATYWNLDQLRCIMVFYVATPIALLIINFAGVWCVLSANQLLSSSRL